ncbi:MAG TPA: anti-sigma factor antagonist, partial [Trebonia sp.]
MDFTADVQFSSGTATVRLAGELGSAAAPRLEQVINDVSGRDGLRHLVLDMADLSYLSSAGLRCLVFAEQKLPAGVPMVLTSLQPDVAETIRLTGFDRSVQIRGYAGALRRRRAGGRPCPGHQPAGPYRRGTA